MHRRSGSAGTRLTGGKAGDGYRARRAAGPRRSLAAAGGKAASEGIRGRRVRQRRSAGHHPAFLPRAAR